MIRFIHLRVESVQTLAEGIVTLRLVPLRAGMELPAFRAGAHIEVQVPTPGVPTARCYALTNPESERNHYDIAVEWMAASPAGFGGLDAVGDGDGDGDGDGAAGMPRGLGPNARTSAAHWLATQVQPGQLLRVSAPRSHWALHDGLSPCLFITQGMGVASVLSMLEACVQAGRPWALHCAGRSRAQRAFLDRMQALSQALSQASPQGLLAISVDGEAEAGLSAPTLDDIIANAPPDAHLYACGPRAWLNEVAWAWQARPQGHLHTESFDAAEALRRGGFQVRLRRSARSISVQPGQTILEAVLGAGIVAAYSCRAGHCGSCAVTVLAGEPEHRDSVLSDEDQHSGRRMMICCSGAKSAELEIDL